MDGLISPQNAIHLGVKRNSVPHPLQLTRPATYSTHSPSKTLSGLRSKLGVNDILKEPYWMTFHGQMRPSKCTLNLKLNSNRIKIEEIMAKKSQRELKVVQLKYTLLN